MLRQRLLDHIKDLKITAQALNTLIGSFDAAGFDWENVTETQLETLIMLSPLRFFTLTDEQKQQITKKG